MSSMKPRGLRNNNPGNLRWSPAINWLGQLSRDSAGYAVFDSTENGIRALYLDLHSKLHRGLDTVQKIIEAFAPQTENPTESYIKWLCQHGFGSPNTKLNDSNLIDLADRIIRFECGEWIDPNQLAVGCALAIKHLEDL